VSHLKTKYKNEIVDSLKTQLQLKNVMQIPHIEKVVINMTYADAVKNAKLLNKTVDEITAITGQKAVITKAKKAISNFKLREGVPLGVKVTLRKDRMWTFLDKLVHFTIPRVRDFRGLSPKGFDGRGNYNMGMKEQIVFPEINYDRVDKIRGMNITICTSSKNDEGGRALLEALGMPFKKKN